MQMRLPVETRVSTFFEVLINGKGGEIGQGFLRFFFVRFVFGGVVLFFASKFI